MKNRRKWLVVAALAAVVACAAAIRDQRLLVSNGEGRVLASFPAAVGSHFTVRFTHSVAKSPVEEIFEITARDEFTLRETWYEDFGWGLPHEELPGQKMEFVDGRVHLTGYTNTFKELRLRVGHIANHELVAGNGAVFRLAEVQRPGGEICLSLARRWPWQR